MEWHKHAAIRLADNAPTTNPSLLAVNLGKMRGGIITGNHPGRLILDDVLSNGSGQNYVLAFTTSLNGSLSNTGVQDNQYSCP